MSCGTVDKCKRCRLQIDGMGGPFCSCDKRAEEALGMRAQVPAPVVFERMAAGDRAYHVSGVTGTVTLVTIAEVFGSQARTTDGVIRDWTSQFFRTKKEAMEELLREAREWADFYRGRLQKHEEVVRRCVEILDSGSLVEG